MLKNELESGTGEVYQRLKTAQDLGLDKKPCDICKKTDLPVSFWGGSSVLVCRRISCLEEMEDRWKELQESYQREAEFENDY